MTQPHLPTIPGHWFWGNLTEFNANTLRFLEKAAPYGDLIQLRFGPFTIYLVNHPDYLHKLLVTKVQAFHKSDMLKHSLRDISGENLFTSDGEFWKNQRKLMQPAFHSRRIGAYADTMVDYALQVIEGWSDEAEIDVDKAMTTITMKVITKTMFDTEVGDETLRIGEGFTRLFKLVNNRIERLFDVPHWVPTPENREIHRLVARLKVVIQGFIDARRASSEDKGDLLSMLLAAQNEDGTGMSDEQVMNEALTIFGAGHETTAYTLTFAWYALSQNPQVVAKLHEEVDNVLAGRQATLEDVPQLLYTTMIIKETLRLYPPAWIFSRTTVEEVEIGGFMLPRKHVVMAAPWLLGRDARWFSDPLTFDPERFNAENEPNIPRYAFIPFGGGPRICIGNQFAMMEATLILATIAQHYDLSLKAGFSTEPQRAFTLRPSNGMKMIAHLREAVPAF